ncbi:Helix-turn-helix domain protein [Anatilimnocola aggregata]|uniref:Helix-turn-helix domain protein n=1 Tax=Anatilimnocola aggregata TaxID=2528021 RepID=A0A517YJ87_9BACT|nr:Helix-turn-helix domain protein [Anatilimnocola aggregata]
MLGAILAEVTAVPRHFTVAQAAELLSVTADRITDWIAAGELTAINIGIKANGGRPTWRISEVELQRFLQCRQSTPVPKVQTKRRTTFDCVPHYFRNK